MTTRSMQLPGVLHSILLPFRNLTGSERTMLSGTGIQPPMSTVTGFSSVTVPGIRAPARSPVSLSARHMIPSPGMGIPIYEISDGGGDANQCTIELISDSGGGMRIAGPAPDAETGRKPVWVNEHTPTVLVASPPAQKGEPRFELTFTIDVQKESLCHCTRYCNGYAG